MPLDITAYTNIARIDCELDVEGEPVHPITRSPIRDYFKAFINPDFPKQADDIEDGVVFSFVESFGFKAGSYSGYNHWREQLAELSNWKLSSYERYGKKWPSHAASAWKATEGPFWELIYFSDCEGIIGPKTSAKLHGDFVAFQHKADTHLGAYFLDRYNDFAFAFEMGAKNGCVTFH